MPNPRWSRVDPERQREILEAAQAEFAAQGLQKASYNRIIEAAGVSKGAMYYYFEDREDLLVTAVEAALAPIAALSAFPEDLPSPEAFWELVETRTLEAVGWLETQPQLGALARSLYEGLRGGAREDGPMAGLMARVYAWLERVLDVGARAGAIRQDLPMDLLARVTMQASVAIDQWMVERWEQMDSDEALRLSAQSMRLLRDLLEPRKI